MLSGEQHAVQTSPDSNPLEPHGQKWEVLDAGIPVCQRATAGLGMNDLRIKWSNQPHSVEDCFNIMFEETKHVRALWKRPLAQRDDSFVEEEDFTVHHLVPIPEYLRQVRQKKAKTENHKKYGSSHFGVACAQSLLHLLITAAQLVAMPMVANHLQCVVLSLGGTVEMCMLSLCTRFEECSNCFTGHLAYTLLTMLFLFHLIWWTWFVIT